MIFFKNKILNKYQHRKSNLLSFVKLFKNNYKNIKMNRNKLSLMAIATFLCSIIFAQEFQAEKSGYNPNNTNVTTNAEGVTIAAPGSSTAHPSWSINSNIYDNNNNNNNNN